MNKQLKHILKDKMKERNIKVPALATALDIPKDRIYKWFQQDTMPKAEDAAKIQLWINGSELDKVPRENSNELQDTEQPDYGKSKPLTESEGIAFLQEHIKDLRAHLEWTKKQFEETKDKLLTNSETDLKKQEEMIANLIVAHSDRVLSMRALKNLSVWVAQILAAGDKKKQERLMSEYRKRLVADGEAKT